eukprot:scaffold9821_cov140-Isochrysis_galbana.AAC.1
MQGGIGGAGSHDASTRRLISHRLVPVAQADAYDVTVHLVTSNDEVQPPKKSTAAPQTKTRHRAQPLRRTWV